MKYVLLISCFLAVGCASIGKSTRTIASVPDDEFYDSHYSPWHLGNMSERFTERMKILGTGCMDGWGRIDAARPEVEAQLAAETKAAIALVEKMNSQISWHAGRPYSEAADSFCSGDTDKILHANLEIMTQLSADFDAEKTKIAAINAASGSKSDTDVHYHRNIHCAGYPKGEFYDNFARQLPHPSSSLVALRELAVFQAKLSSSIQDVQALLASNAKNCK